MEEEMKSPRERAGRAMRSNIQVTSYEQGSRLVHSCRGVNIAHTSRTGVQRIPWRSNLRTMLNFCDENGINNQNITHLWSRCSSVEDILARRQRDSPQTQRPAAELVKERTQYGFDYEQRHLAFWSPAKTESRRGDRGTLQTRAVGARQRCKPQQNKPVESHPWMRTCDLDLQGQITSWMQGESIHL